MLFLSVYQLVVKLPDRVVSFCLSAGGEAGRSDGGQSTINRGPQQEAEGPKETQEEGPK